MLRALAARRVGDVPENVTVHYVSQEVNLSEAKQEMLPVECVVEVRCVVTLDCQGQGQEAGLPDIQRLLMEEGPNPNPNPGPQP